MPWPQGAEQSLQRARPPRWDLSQEHRTHSVASLEGESGFAHVPCSAPELQALQTKHHVTHFCPLDSSLPDNPFLGPKLPLLGNHEVRPNSHEDKESPRGRDRCFSAKTLMQ